MKITINKIVIMGTFYKTRRKAVYMIFPKTSTENFAKWVVENKPYLVEIEEEIQKMGQFGEIEIKLSIRGGRVEKL